MTVVSGFDRPEAVTCSTEVDMRSVTWSATQSLTRSVSPGAPTAASRGQRSSSRSTHPPSVSGRMKGPSSQTSRQSSSSHRAERRRPMDTLSQTQRHIRTRPISQCHTSSYKTPSLQHPIRLNPDYVSHESQNARSQPSWAVVTWV